MIDRIIYVWRWFTQVQVVYQRNGHITMWWARDEADALEWLRVIKHGTVVYGKRGKFMGGRRTVAMPKMRFLGNRNDGYRLVSVI